MEEREGVLETKLDVLIQDFQRFRMEQHTINKELTAHSSEENKVQAEILTTLKWHTVIGSFMMGIIMMLVYKLYGGVL